MVKYNRTPVGQRMMNAVSPYARIAAHNTAKYSGKYIARRLFGGKNKSAVKSTQGITNQADRASIYRRKRAPYRMRRKARRSMKAFQMKLLKNVGTRTVVNNQLITRAFARNQQDAFSLVIYGGKSDLVVPSQQGYDDMNDIRQRDYLIGDQTGDTQNRFTNGTVKFCMMTAVMDITIENKPVSDEGQSFPLELDIYEFTCRQMSDLYGETVENALQSLQNDMRAPGGAQMNTPLELSSRGITPFEMGVPMSQFGMKILKKTKYFIPVNDTITYQIRKSKPVWFNDQNLFRSDSPTTKATHGILIIAKTLPTYQASTNFTDYSIGVTRKYKYKVVMSNASRGAKWEPVG